ncbi:MAG: glutamate formimidoyltransferase [Haliscomenobacter sp.]|nr:glutamate formimidoyltransferase [Haliscomenobacter sp.]
MALLECVPNFSEGRTPEVIRQIAESIERVDGVFLLDVDPGKATNRTVMTFAGPPEAVVEAAFHAIKTAAALIDMAGHQGAHPRMGATDVCPLIPIEGLTMEEAAAWARRLGERVGHELNIPVFLYEYAASVPERRNLATIRSGEYEGLPAKLKDPSWAPDFGPAEFNERSGATVIGARDFLAAYNVNLNTTSSRRANAVAFDVREQGRILREGDPVTGPIVLDDHGEPVRIPGTCKSVKAIGWYIEEYEIAQVSMNLTNLSDTSVHEAFEACCASAHNRGMRVTGSELVGMIPLNALLSAGKHFLRKQQRSVGVSEEEILRIAIRSLGLNELSAFDPRKKILEYRLEDLRGEKKLIDLTLRNFADETASESVAPGGGSVAAYAGALGASLGAMVANLSSHRRGWDHRWEAFSQWAEQGAQIKSQLLLLVDEDTKAFMGILDAFRLPKSTPDELVARKEAIQAATRRAIEVPAQTMEQAYAALDLLEAMVRDGNPNSVSDAGVGALCVRAAVHGAWLNVQTNTGGLKDAEFVRQVSERGQFLAQRTEERVRSLIQLVEEKIRS